MADNTGVNPQIKEAIDFVNAKVLGDAPAVALGNMMQATSHALGLAMLNATNAQQQTNMTAQATTTMGVTTLYSIDTATDAAGTADILKIISPATGKQ